MAKKQDFADVEGVRLIQGDLVELVLCKGTEFDNGLQSPAPTTDMQGYRPSERGRIHKPGFPVTGYFVGVRESGAGMTNRRLIMARDLQGEESSGTFYVREDCILRAHVR
jgi:hypothetical protein